LDKRIIVCGSRTYTDKKAIQSLLLTLPEDIIIVEGDAKGADRLAGFYARKFSFRLEEYPALWSRYGNSAGYFRNLQMSNLDNVIGVFAFYVGNKPTIGTNMMIKLAMEKSLLVICVES
jgi:hypothetical protein